MRRLDRVLSRVAERGDPLGADLLIDHLERKLAGEPDPIVVARQRSGIMQTFKEKTDQQPGPPPRRKGLAVALASFIVVLLAGGGFLVWNALDDDSVELPAAEPTTTLAPTTTAASTTTTTAAAPVDAVGTFSFNGTTWSYDGPTTIGSGTVTFSLVNTSSHEVAVFSFFGLDEEEIDAELATTPVGTDIGPYADAPPIPPSDFFALVEAGPGETVSAAIVMAGGAHLIDAATFSADGTEYLWRVALIEVVEP